MSHWLLLSLYMFPAPAGAGEAISPGPVLPPPRVLQAPGAVAVVPPGFYRPDPYAHWQLRALNRQRYFRARAVWLPGAVPFYPYTGEPFLRLPAEQQRVFMPFGIE